MRNVVRFTASLAALGLLLSAAAAQPLPLEPEDDAPAMLPPAPAPTPQSGEAAEPSRLEKLFAELKRERNEKAAARIANQIWAEWMKSGSASIDLMMKWSTEATQKKTFDVALDFLDQVVTLEPDYAEGWNRRATVHFMMENYAKSMADLERTLRLEPRHFGALSGMGAILKSTGRKELALDAFGRVLEVYPMMRNAQSEVATLSDELAGQGI